jgi:hypothetical protein
LFAPSSRQATCSSSDVDEAADADAEIDADADAEIDVEPFATPAPSRDFAGYEHMNRKRG